MTELEKREKAIEEMIEIAFPTYRNERDVIAIQRLYDAGYRKEEEVIKETLQKLFKVVKENVFDYGTDAEEGLFLAIDINTLTAVIAEQFGVEINE